MQRRAHGSLAALPAKIRFTRSNEFNTAEPLPQPDFNPAWPGHVSAGRINGALNKSTRAALVSQTQTQPASAKRVTLSALGAWFDAEGEWQGAQTLASWEHQMAMGRELYASTETRGILYPLGHEAILVELVRLQCRSAAVAQPRPIRTCAYQKLYTQLPSPAVYRLLLGKAVAVLD